MPSDAAAVSLVVPSPAYLPGYAAALETGWSPNTTRNVSAAQLASIGQDPAAFLDDLVRHEGGTVTLAEGVTVPRLPSRVRWVWDGDFCGSINLRFQHGTQDLPPHVSGHIGYAIVPWKRGRGYATRALALMLGVAHGLDMKRVLVTCDVGNEGSRRVIEANGGVAAGIEPVEDGEPKRLYWIETTASAV